ncbi:MAG: sigma-54 dependent transcriptional regulator [Bryobacteraceae bacterium]
MATIRILVVEDDDNLRRVTKVQLQDDGYKVESASGAAEALSILESAPQDLVLTDLKMPGMSGLELLKRIRQEYPETAVILVTAFGSIESAVEAIKLGAYDYITKPVNPDALRLTLRRALDHLRLRDEVRTLRSSLDQKYGFESIIGRSSSLLFILDTATRAAQSDATVLIRGETGTGKELLAKGIHFNSRRRDRPFVTINCGAIPRELLESELFGHVRGAFTGAVAHKKGKVELAEGGTLFLDEIGDVPLDLQVKLLRLIQERQIEKIGEGRPAAVDVRIIAATHRNLQAMVEGDEFREDLFYRLNVIPLELPPLRDRPEDIPELVEHFLVQSQARHDRRELRFAEGLMGYFRAYRWPGNVRELENVIERLVVLSRAEEVTVQDLPEMLRRQRPPLESLQLEIPANGISLEAVEKDLIKMALEKFGGNQTHAARFLDISRKTLIYRMEKFGLKIDDAGAE